MRSRQSIGSALSRLHRTHPPAGAPDFRESFAWLAASWDALTPPLRQRAEDLTARLADVAPPPVLLHGDLGPYNVVVSPRGPVFIDPIGSRGLPAWDLARLAAAWEALGRSRILAPLLAGYGERPPFLAETLAWTALVYLQKNLPFPETPLRPHLLPLLDELYSAETPQRFLTYFLKD